MEVRLALCLLIACCLVTAASAAGSSIKPEGYVRQCTILGPFPNPERPPTQEDRGAFDIDYLSPLGGAAQVRDVREDA